MHSYPRHSHVSRTHPYHRSLLCLTAMLPIALSAVLSRNASAQSGCGKAFAEAHWKPVKSIDFSSKHNVMIRSQDGTLTPMDVPYYKSTQVAPGVWQIESDGDYSYLIEGDKEALAIDTGYGAGNIREYLQTLTRKPVRFVANTHNHFDHTANDAYFDCAYMSSETAKLATIPFASFSGVSFSRDYPKVIVGDGYTIDLGNRVLEAFIIPNHTTGGTAYLDRKSRILFSGDEIFKGSITISAVGSVAQYQRNMAKLEAHRSEFDQLATGGFGMIEGSYVDKFLHNTQYILAGNEGGPASARGGPGGPGGPGGGPGGPGGGPGRGLQTDAEGHTVYTRRFPRPGDSAESSLAVKPQPIPPEDVRRMTYDGVNVTYDIRHIQN